MLRILLMILVLTMLSACGKGTFDGGPKIIPANGANKPPRKLHAVEIEAYFLDFEQQYNIDTGVVDTYFTSERPEFSGPIAGICLSRGTIYINAIIWPTLEVTRQKALIYHELGHCLLRREHDATTYPDGCPKSIMQSELVTDDCYKNHEAELLQELIDNRADK